MVKWGSRGREFDSRHSDQTGAVRSARQKDREMQVSRSFCYVRGHNAAAWLSTGSGLYSLRIEYVLNSENQPGIGKADFASKIYNHIF